MPSYRYRAVDANGKVVRGTADAADPGELAQRLSHMGLDLLHAAPRRIARGQRIARQELIEFCFHLEQLVAAGVPLIDGLRDLRDSVERAAVRETVTAIIASIESGQTFSQALAEHAVAFDSVFVGLVRAGEQAGKLPAVLASLAEQLRWEDELASRTRTLMLYPLLVTGVVGAVTVFLLVFLVPQLAAFIRGMGRDLPLQTRLLLWLSETLVAHGWLVVAAAAGLLIGGYLLPRNQTWLREWVDRLKLTLPLIGPIQRKIVLSRFASSFALMYGSGIVVLDALRQAEEVMASRPLQMAVRAAAQRVADGSSLAGAFANAGMFPPLVVRMLHVGEHTGALDTALWNVSGFYNREVRQGIERLQALIEPALTLLLGALLAWVMLAVLGPVYDTIAGIKL